MISGVHLLLYSTDPEADQAALDTILQTRSVSAGGGRSIMALPPAEIATHDGDGAFTQRHADRDLQGAVVYLMCDDLPAAVEALSAEGIRCTRSEETEFGSKATILLPSGAELGLYRPSHPTAID